MLTIDYIKQANRNLWTSKIRSILTIGSIFIGTLVLILTLSVGEGVKDFVSRQTEGFTIQNVLEVSKEGNSFGEITGIGDAPAKYRENTEFGFQLLTDEDLVEISKIEGIERVIPAYQVNLKYFVANGEKYTTFADLYNERMNLDLASGDLENFDPKTDVVVGFGFTKSFGVDSAEELLNKEFDMVVEDALGKEITKTVRIKGVLTNSFILNSFMLMGEDVAKELFEYQNTTSFNAEMIGSLLESFNIDAENLPEGIELDDLNAMLAAQSPNINKGKHFAAYAELPIDLSAEEVSEVKAKLKENGFSAASQQDRLDTFDSLITNVQIALGAFSIIALVASLFGVVNTLLMSIYERTKEIGLMKSLGMKDRGIFLLLSIEASVIGFWGSFIGAVVSVILGTFINNVAANTLLKDFDGFSLIVFSPGQIIGVIISIMIVTFIAGTLPAIKAMRLDPIDALRYE